MGSWTIFKWELVGNLEAWEQESADCSCFKKRNIHKQLWYKLLFILFYVLSAFLSALCIYVRSLFISYEMSTVGSMTFCAEGQSWDPAAIFK